MGVLILILGNFDLREKGYALYILLYNLADCPRVFAAGFPAWAMIGFYFGAGSRICGFLGAFRFSRKMGFHRNLAGSAECGRGAMGGQLLILTTKAARRKLYSNCAQIVCEAFPTIRAPS